MYIKSIAVGYCFTVLFIYKILSVVIDGNLLLIFTNCYYIIFLVNINERSTYGTDNCYSKNSNSSK